jgi:prolipoprotein diacylglyceryltransferase
LASLSIFAFLWWRYSRKSRDGEIFVLYLALYAVARFFLEFLRGDEDRGFVFHRLLSTSQFIAILAFTTAVWMALTLRRKPARQQAWGVETTEGVARGNPRINIEYENVAPSAKVKAATTPHAPKRARD